MCIVHGGRAPQVQEAAKLRLAMLVDPALEVMFESLGPKQPAAIRLSAAKDILDRTGYKPVERSENINWNGDPGSLSEDQLDTLMAYLEKLIPADRLEAARQRAMIEAGTMIDVKPVESTEEEWK